MAQFDLDSYEPVDERIKRFLKDHKDGRIITELICDEEVRVVFKAHLFLDEIEVSTGYAKEVVGKGFVNQTSALENCETSAIGRALANYGYSGDKRSSREEMEKVQRVTQLNRLNILKGLRRTPTPAPVKRSAPIPASTPPTPKLLKCEHCGTLGKWHKKDCPNFLGVSGDKIVPEMSLDEGLASLDEMNGVTFDQ